MANELQGRRIAFLAAPEGTEQVELTAPWEAVAGAGAIPELISTQPGDIQGFNHLEKGDRFAVDRVVGKAKVGVYDGLVLPGGVANPDYLRQQPEAVWFVRGFFDAGKPVAAICHAPWTLIEADVVQGRTLTSFPSLKTDLRNAGATWVDEEVVIDGGLITSRDPGDLPAFCRAILETFAGWVKLEAEAA
jgi:protease I